jgi:tetratricopeptide (TPR) repeat protein
MTTDEHPEHLLDRALAGDLAAAERAAFDLHLAACPACALHLALATQLRDEAVAPARDEALNRLAIAGALARQQESPRRSAWRVGGISLRLAAASVLLFAGLVAAAASFRLGRPQRTAADRAQIRTPPPKNRPSESSVPVATAGIPASAPPGVDTLAPGPIVNAPQDAVASTRRSERATKVVPSAADLFGRASDLRHGGRLEQAIDAYRVLQQRYPHTREANLSYALAGRLQLERDRPEQALTEFDRYLKIDAEVTEEVLAGRTEALRRLGRRGEEAAAWRLLLARFPGSIYSDRARSRLTVLDQVPSSLLGPGMPERR